MLVWDKHSSLLSYFVSYANKKFYNFDPFDPRQMLLKLFLSVIYEFV
jgi:hypothetical protein